MDYNVKKRKSHFGKAIMLLVGLVFVIYFLNKVSNTNMIGKVLKAFEQSSMKYDNLVEFSEEERDSIKKTLSGFWTYTTDSTADVFIDDKLEVTKNGYIWQVEHIHFVLPSGKTKKLLHAVHAYLHPSSKITDSSSLVNCVWRTFNQIWINDEDTCEIRKYVEYRLREADSTFNYFDRVIDINTNDRQRITMEGRKYTLSVNPDMKTFFPSGIIEELYNQTACENIPNADMYKIQKGAVTLTKPLKTKSTINIRVIKECAGEGTLREFLRGSIADDLQTGAISEYTLSEILFIIKKYYIPYSIKPYMDYYLSNQKNGCIMVDFSFDIIWKGTTDNVKITIGEKTIGNKIMEREIAQEVKQWKFQSLEKENTPFKVVFTDTLTN